MKEKTISIKIRDKFDHEKFYLSEKDEKIKQEFNTIMAWLIKNLHDSKVIYKVINELTQWQNMIIEQLAED